MNKQNFWIDLVSRFFSDNPKFFKYIQYVSIVVAAITGLPELIGYFGITLSGKWLVFENKTLAIAAIVAAFIAKLPNKDVNAIK